MTDDQIIQLRGLQKMLVDADSAGQMGCLFAQVYPVSGFIAVKFFDHEK